MPAPDDGRTAKWFVPWMMLGPGLLWLVLFFIVPMFSLARNSLQDRGLTNYSDAFSQQGTIIGRTFVYTFACSVLCLLIGYPLAYFIAMRGGKRKNLFLALVVLPFFTTYLIRTISWVVLLRNDGPVVRLIANLHLTGVFRFLGLVGGDGQVFGRAPAVIGALTYNFLPFMVLPIYVSLEKIDRRLLEAGPDLYATSARTFRKVTFPLSLPGVFGGSLLTFIPASGDFINATLLGSERTKMIGNIIERNFLKPALRPESSALSFVLMAIILIGVLVYARLLGTEELV